MNKSFVSVQAFLFSCLIASQAAPNDREQAFFEKYVRPVLVEHCYECHSEQNGKREGGLVLDSRAGWEQGGQTGASIIPGDPDGSLFIRAIRYSDDEVQMPPDEKLSAEQIRKLELWILNGAVDPRERPTKRGGLNNESLVDPSDPVAGRQHWAFQPLTNERPPTSSSAWPQSTIDRYILASLRRNKLTPSRDAARLDLVKRVYVQLVGVLPSYSQIQEFVHDDRPDALQRLVDRLLASPQFGERWGRHWLDLARYADSNGLDENFLFREAWRYRNWVISSINEDESYPKFLLHQLAGDLLPYESVEQRDEQRIASGFMVIGPKVLLGNNPQERIMDAADEQLDTIGRAVLGQTLGCARCHDHKFDPIPTDDYYALAGILTSTEVLQKRYMLGQQRTMERLQGLGPEGDEKNAAYEEYWRSHPAVKQKATAAKSALDLLKKNDAVEFVKLAQKQPKAIADDAADVRRPVDQRINAQKRLVDELAKVLTKPAGIPPRAMIPADSEAPHDEAIRLSGQFDRKGRVVPRGFLTVFSDRPTSIPADRSGRLELANWLVDEHYGAGNLAARVWANRIWYHLMGRGLVRTVDNFGRTGEAATHPKLLDYLARELISSGWSLKHLVRQIVLSRTFALSSAHDDCAHDVDPENSLLWRAHRRRLDPESLRDSMLNMARELDFTPMQSSVWYLGDQATAVGANKNRRRTDFPARSVYLPVIRNDLPELFDAFDFADPHATTGMRPQTMMPPQGLFMLNDQLVQQAADAMAQRLVEQPQAGGLEADEIKRLATEAFITILGSQPSEIESKQFVDFIKSTVNEVPSDSDSKVRAVSLLCHALFASSRFQVLD